MKFISAALLGFVLSAVQAYTPPSDQPDGAYAVHFDESGNPITKRYEMARSVRRGPAPEPEAAVSVNYPAEAESALERRDFPGQQVGCTGRNIGDHYDYSVVQNCLGTWLNQHSGQNADKAVYYCRKGNTLLAICIYQPVFGNNPIAGSPGEINNFNGVMDRTCGAWRSGWVFIKDWNKTYWRTTWGESVCDNAGGPEVRQQVYA